MPVPLFVGAPVIFGSFFLCLIVVMVVLLIRTIRGLDEDELESADEPGLIQRLYEAFRGLRFR